MCNVVLVSFGAGENSECLYPGGVDGMAQVSCQFEYLGNSNIVDVETVFVRKIEAGTIENELCKHSVVVEQGCNSVTFYHFCCKLVGALLC